MKFRLATVSLLATLTGAFALTMSPAQATVVANDNPCKISGWYVNPDETADAPDETVNGFVFEGKDLIHHATAPIDLPDIKNYTGNFVATTPGKVVFKMETENPYSTIVQDSDGKFWSTAMTYAQVGGQGSPVDNVSDLVGKPTKPGKAEYGATSHVVTFGVGYWVEEGTTTVTSIAFHGTKYDLTCKVQPSPSSASPTGTIKPTQPTTTKTSTHTSTSSTVAAGGTGDNGGQLAITGNNTALMVALGATVLAAGIALFAITRRRRNHFIS